MKKGYPRIVRDLRSGFFFGLFITGGMMKQIVLWLMTGLMILGFSSSSLSSPHGDDHTGPSGKEKGILLVTFGTSVPSAKIAFENIENKVKAAFPGVPVRWAYTSKIIRDKLAKQNEYHDSVEMALAKMMDEGFKQVALQSLHMIGGFEFHDVKVNAERFENMSGGIRKVMVGYPMLSTPKDLDDVVQKTISVIPKERKADEAVILMGHGTHHPANAFYESLMYRFQKTDPNIYVGTVEGSPTLDDIRKSLLEKKTKTAYLIPFMSVAGDHAINDLAGDEEDSWKSVLTKDGIRCVPVLKGMAEYDEFVDIWLSHLKIAMDHLK